MATIPSILVGKTWAASGATTASYLQGGTTLSQIGPDVAATLSAAPVADAQFGGFSVIKFRGRRFAFDMSTAGTMRIKRFNKYSNTWDVVHETTITTSSTIVPGLHPYQESNGVSGIFVAYHTTGTNVSVTKTTDGVTWTTTAVGSGSAMTINAFGRAHMHRNKLIYATSNSGNTTTWRIVDPVGLTVTEITTLSDGVTLTSIGINCVAAYATFNNRLFMLLTRITPPTTTVAAGSNGVNVNTFAGAGVLNVGATSAFAATGTLNVVTGSGIQVVTYTGKGASTFTGCNCTGAGVLATGGSVTSASEAQAQLYEIVGGVWSSVVGLGLNSTTVTSANLAASAHVLLPIGNTKLVAIIKADMADVGGTVGNGTRAYDLTPSGSTFTVSEVTSTLIPAALRNGGGSGTNSQRWTGFVDDVTTPGTPAVYVFLLSDNVAAGTISYYEYTDSTTILTPGSLGPAANQILPHCMNGGGSYIAADGDLDVWLTAQTPILAGVRFAYTAAGLITGAAMRTSVRAATTATLPNSPTQAGTGVGKTLTAGANVAFPTLDGVAPLLNGRYLVKDQGSFNNGIYTLTALGSGAAPWVLTRAVDFDQTTEVYNGAFVYVGGGTVNGGKYFMQTTANPISMETETLTFTQVTPPGIFRRSPCRVATNGALPAYTPAGSGASRTLTGTAVGVLAVDSVNLVFGNRVVVKDHGADNGLYSVTTEGTPSVAFVLTRASDANAVGQAGMIPGLYAYVSEGTVNGSQFFEMTTDGQLVMETTSFVFTSRLPVEWKVYFSVLENTLMSQGTLYGAATGGDSLRAGNLVSRVSPDFIEAFTADWRAGTGGDGLQSGQAITAFQRLNV